MASRLTRRQMAAALAAPALAAGQAAPSVSPAPGDEPAKIALDLMEQNRQALAKVDVPIDIEPVTHFQA